MSRVVIDENLCKGCALCTTACPQHLLVEGDHFNNKGYTPVVFLPITINADCNGDRLDSRLERTCSGCALCARMCPDVAIRVYRSIGSSAVTKNEPEVDQRAA
jgi:2-oxoglutarate ferredoxin oxidoreductase subunit delta